MPNSQTIQAELFLIAKRLDLDPEKLLLNVLELAHFDDEETNAFLTASRHIKHDKVNVFDAIHAAHCGKHNTIISSDKVFDRLGIKRIKLNDKPRTKAA